MTFILPSADPPTMRLVCPECGDDYMHENGEPFTVVPDPLAYDGRRNWLAIPVRGESCNHRWLLKIHFYKGQAFVDAVRDTRCDAQAVRS